MKIDVHIEAHVQMFIVNMIHNSQKGKTTQKSTNRRMDKLRYPSAMDYYAATKRNDVLADATTEMNVEQMMLSSRSLTQRPRIVLSLLYDISSTGKTIETESQLETTTLEEEGMGSDY